MRNEYVCMDLSSYTIRIPSSLFLLLFFSYLFVHPSKLYVASMATWKGRVQGLVREVLRRLDLVRGVTVTRQVLLQRMIDDLQLVAAAETHNLASSATTAFAFAAAANSATDAATEWVETLLVRELHLPPETFVGIVLNSIESNSRSQDVVLSQLVQSATVALKNFLEKAKREYSAGYVLNFDIVGISIF